MLDINFLKKSGYFNEKVLEKGETLISEGKIDNNIYIIITGELSVEKFTTKEKDEKKILAYLKKDDIFGEAALNSNEPKQVSIIAKTKTSVIYVNAQKGLENFSQKYPKEALNILKYIIHLSNQRLQEANYLITATYKISKEIIELEKISNKTVFELIEKLKSSINVSDIIYYETNPVMQNYITLRYDTREPNTMQNKIIELTESNLDLLGLKMQNFHIINQKLSIGNNVLGYLVFIKKGEKFDDSDKKVIATTSTSIAGVIKQKQLYEEERDKEFSEL